MTNVGLFATAAFSMAVAVPCHAQVGHSWLIELAIPEDSLPEGCRIADIPADTVPEKALANPGIVKDAGVIRALCSGEFRGLFDLSTVKAMFFAAYKEQDDIGVVAWRFISKSVAQEGYDKLLRKYSQQPGRMAFWRHQEHVIMLWRDPGVSHSCFGSFSAHIQRVLEKIGIKQGANVPPRVSRPIAQLQDFDILGQCFSFDAEGIVVHDEGTRIPKKVDLLHYDGRLYANHYSNDSAYYSGKGAILHLGEGEINSFKAAPREGYTYALRFEELHQGHCYCVRAGRGRQYGLIRVLSVQRQPALLKFEWRYPLPVAKRNDQKTDHDFGTPKVTLNAGIQKDADAALSVLKRFLRLWEDEQYENASLLVLKPLRKKYVVYLQKRPIELKSIDDITIREFKNGLRARVHFTIVPKGEVSLDMVFRDGKWWMAGG